MTDNEIIKALEVCAADEIKCEDCPYHNMGRCSDFAMQDALNLINRQKAKIERLKDYNANLLTGNTALSNEIFEIKFEAIKEFAERLKNDYSDILHGAAGVEVREINNLVKEMTESEEKDNA